MANEMDIDNILEDDMINALDSLGDISIENKDETTTIDNNNREFTIQEEKVINVDSSNIDDISSIFKELLNNKSLEITIRLKEN